MDYMSTGYTDFRLTTITSSWSAILAPLYIGTVVVPLLKLPPYIQTSTAFFCSPTCGFVQTFKTKQSSLKVVPLGVDPCASTARLDAVTFAAARTAGGGRDVGEVLGITGHEFPWGD